MTKLKLRTTLDEVKIDSLIKAGCTVTGTEIEIPGELSFTQSFESQKNTQEMIYIYFSIYQLKGSARLICRERIAGMLTKMKITVELFVFLNEEGA